MEAIRARLEAQRNNAIEKLQQIRGSSEMTSAELSGVEAVIEEGDKAQASLSQHLEVTTYERLAERISRLTAALQRMDEGTYGVCDRCGRGIAPRRLEALPEATTCVACQEQLERARRVRRPVGV